VQVLSRTDKIATKGAVIKAKIFKTQVSLRTQSESLISPQKNLRRWGCSSIALILE